MGSAEVNDIAASDAVFLWSCGIRHDEEILYGVGDWTEDMLEAARLGSLERVEAGH